MSWHQTGVNTDSNGAGGRIKRRLQAVDRSGTLLSKSDQMIKCETLFRSRSRSLDMAVTGDSGKKKRGGKVFGSLERGLDKVITMLTPSKRRALRDGPRKIKVQKM